MRSIGQVVDEANVKVDQSMKGIRESYITRWGKINDAIDSIQEGEIIVIGGRPGAGKSAFSNLLIQDIFDSHLNPYPTLGLYFSLEMPAYQQVIRWYSNEQRMESKKILSSRNPINESTFEALKRTGNKLKRMNLVFHDIPLIPEAIANTVADAVHKHKGKRIFLIVDHSRLVIGDADRERIKIEKLVGFANTLKNQYGVVSILISQMNRDIEKERDRKRMGTSLPVMGDLFAASAMEQYATTVMLLHRPEMYNVNTFMNEDTENLLVVNVAKQRNGWIGAVFLKSDFQYYDIHDGNTVTITESGYVYNFAQ